jgi:hypothetical protein
VSIFHEWTAPGGEAAVRSAAVEPWEAWPPAPGVAFVVQPVTQQFRVANVDHEVGAALLAETVVDELGSGLWFATGLSTSAPTSILFNHVAGLEQQPSAAMVLPGYDTPPVAGNIGYVASLAAWDERDINSGVHALKYTVGVDTEWALGATASHGKPDLACASERIAAAGARAGSSWLIAAGSGSELQSCTTGASAGAPTSLAIDRITWGAKDKVDWTVHRVASIAGAGAIKQIEMTAALGGAWVAVRRAGKAEVELYRLDPNGELEVSAHAPKKPLETVAHVALAPIMDDGLLVALVDSGRPTEVAVELRDREGVLRASTTVGASGAVGSLALLEAQDGSNVLLAWTTAASSSNAAKLQIARLGCEGGS